MQAHSRVSCSWQSPVDINGLNPEDQLRIRQIGLHAWIREVKSPKPKQDVQNVQQIQKQEVKVQLKQVEAAKPTGKVKPTSVGYPLAMEFIRLAKANNDIVTYDQCTAMCPAYPGDPVSWAREWGLQIQTERKLQRYKVLKYV